jgi:flagellar hook-associated protein 2
MSSTGSFSMSGLLGGTAGQIDVTSLIAQLMQAEALPQTQLKDQLTAQTSQLTTYQTINSKLAAVLTAGQKLTDATTWAATSASSSNAAVVATSSAGAPLGTTTFNVARTAQAQISTITAAADGTVVTTPANGITITGSDGVAHPIALSSGSATDVAAAINAAKVGVSANVVNTDSGQVLQLTSNKTGAANAFTFSGFDDPSPKTVATAQDAQISVGDPLNGGYTVSSSTNSFTNVIPGVTFSVSAPATNVSITVDNGLQAISDAVGSLVDSANAATAEMNKDTAQGAVLATNSTIESITQSMLYSVSRGTSTGACLTTYGITMDKNGVLSFDAAAFAAAFNADPVGTQSAITDFATSLNTTTDGATNPTSGSITESISACTTSASKLNDEIGTWNDRLAKIKDAYTAKFTAMETALAKMQSQQTYLTSMFKSTTGNSGSTS